MLKCVRYLGPRFGLRVIKTADSIILALTTRLPEMVMDVVMLQRFGVDIRLACIQVISKHVLSM